MHRLSASFILGYHGCDASVAEALLGGDDFKSSNNDYDWLGPGVYFWEANPQRGLDFAAELAARKPSSIEKPALVGAIIDLGLCLDMTTMSSIKIVKAAYESLKETVNTTGGTMPTNRPDLLLRRLDCAVIRRAHSILEQQGLRIDTVRGLFVEGKPLYETAGFMEKTHSQIAVCNLACIKGVFRVPQHQLR